MKLTIKAWNGEDTYVESVILETDTKLDKDFDPDLGNVDLVLDDITTESWAYISLFENSEDYDESKHSNLLGIRYFFEYEPNEFMLAKINDLNKCLADKIANNVYTEVINYNGSESKSTFQYFLDDSLFDLYNDLEGATE